MWSIVSGSFLGSRGAIFGALLGSGFSAQEIRRSWQALRHGVWSIGRLVENWRAYVESQAQWQPNSYEGYRALSIDTTTFWRPRLVNWVGQFYHRIANRTMKGVGFGVMVEVGQVAGHRIPLLKAIVPASVQTDSEKTFKQDVLWHATRHLAGDEVAVHDAGASIADMQAVGMARYVVRLASNCTARRNVLPAYQGRGRPPEYGEVVRPLARTHNGQTISATPPDVETHFQYQERTIRVQGWQGLVRRDQKVSTQNQTFTVWVFFDPLYRNPLVLGANLPALPQTNFHLYLDRWPVEQVPLAAKQLLGLHRHFVWAPLSCQRLPALALLAGNILTYLAAVLPPVPSGFWDRHPKKHQVAFGALWNKQIFQMITRWTANFVKSARTQPIYPKVVMPVDKPKPQLDPIFATDSRFFVSPVNVLATRSPLWLLSPAYTTAGLSRN
jgi:hypothetical protein